MTNLEHAANIAAILRGAGLASAVAMERAGNMVQWLSLMPELESEERRAGIRRSLSIVQSEVHSGVVDGVNRYWEENNG